MDNVHGDRGKERWKEGVAPDVDGKIGRKTRTNNEVEKIKYFKKICKNKDNVKDDVGKDRWWKGLVRDGDRKTGGKIH